MFFVIPLSVFLFFQCYRSLDVFSTFLLYFYRFPFPFVFSFHLVPFLSENVYFLRAFSHILDRTLIPDPIVFYDDAFDALSAMLASKLSSSAVNEQPVQLEGYSYEKVQSSPEQITNLTFPLHFIQCGYLKDLVRSMRGITFNYRNGMMTATWFTG